MQEQKVFHGVRVSKIKQIRPLTPFTNANNHTWYGIEINFSNGDYANLWKTDMAEIDKYSTGDVIQYRIVVTISKDINGVVTGTRQNLDYCERILPPQVVKYQKLHDTLAQCAMKAAEIAAPMISNEGDFKDAASMVYAWMRETVINENYNIEVEDLSSN